MRPVAIGGGPHAYRPLPAQIEKCSRLLGYGATVDTLLLARKRAPFVGEVGLKPMSNCRLAARPVKPTFTKRINFLRD